MIYTDQMMREVRLLQPPSRIISLVPSITELLFDMGLYDQIEGITKFCIHPDSIFKNKKKIGGTKKVNHQKIEQINPDLIIANKEENTKEDIEALEKKYPVWVSDVKNLNDALEMISMLGEITGKQAEALKIINRINENFELIKPKQTVSVLYLIWNNPYMAAGAATFINDMLLTCGFENVLKDKTRYPEIDEALLQQLNPEVVLLSSEPYPFKEKHCIEIKAIIPQCHVELVDGEYFSWYGSRLLGSPDYFNQLMNKINSSNPAAGFYEN